MKETTLANIENLALKHITLQSDYVSPKNNLYETCLNEIKKHFYQDNVELFDNEIKDVINNIKHKYDVTTFNLYNISLAVIKKILCKHLFVILQKQYNVINLSLDELTNLIDVKSINYNYNSCLYNEQICISINQINLVNFINKYLNGKYCLKCENGKYCIYNKDNLNLADSIFSNKTWTDIDLENFILHYRNINNFIFSLNSSVDVLKNKIKSLQFNSDFL